MRTPCFSTFSPRSLPGGLSDDDVAALALRMDEYMAEFEKNGVNNLKVDI